MQVQRDTVTTLPEVGAVLAALSVNGPQCCVAPPQARKVAFGPDGPSKAVLRNDCFSVRGTVGRVGKVLPSIVALIATWRRMASATKWAHNSDLARAAEKRLHKMSEETAAREDCKPSRKHPDMPHCA